MPSQPRRGTKVIAPNVLHPEHECGDSGTTFHEQNEASSEPDHEEQPSAWISWGAAVQSPEKHFKYFLNDKTLGFVI